MAVFNIGSELSELMQMPRSMKTIEHLIYWRDFTKSAIVFCIGFTALLILTTCSFITIAAYVALAALAIFKTVRLYQTLFPGKGGSLSVENCLATELTEAQLQRYVRAALPYLNALLSRLRHLYLGIECVSTVKYAVALWLMTYVGAVFNASTLLLVGFIGIFTLPKLYVEHRPYFERQLALIRIKIGRFHGVYYKLFGAEQAITDATQQESEF